jgi:cytoskeletal protein RodZ
MASFGEEIRRERELREITLREISEATKISMRYLDALERNDFRHLPGGVFNKGFVRAYAQFIGADAEAMVNAYLLEEQTQEARATQKESTRRSTAPAPTRFREPKAKPRRAIVLAVVALVVLGGILLTVYLWRGKWPLRSAARGHSTPIATPAGEVS